VVVNSLDCRGQRCPLPIVSLAMAVRGLAVGEELEILVTDPAFPADIQAWIRKTGHALLAMELTEGVHKAVIRRVG
jgi:tRNA 2-thiouridine synthesizing protein A